MTRESAGRLSVTLGVMITIPMAIWLWSIAATAASWKQQQQAPPAPPRLEPLAADPIAAIGHGAIIGQDGKNVQVTAQFIQMVQDFYLKDLLAAGRQGDKQKQLVGTDIEAAQRAIGAATKDKILANALFIDWLVEKVQPTNRAHIVTANNALRWHYVLKIQENAPLPVNNQWAKGLSADVARRLQEQLGITILSLTNAAGEAYCQECLDAGVPVPSLMFGEEWRFVGEVTEEFLEEPGSERAELWIYESQSPPGVCLALPRFPQSGNEAKLFGVICLGTATGKVCFFDNPRGRYFERGVAIDFKKEFLGGTDLVANSQGTCTDCHAGENPYVVHPDKPPFASVLSRIQSPVWHDPLVDGSWPQNPGPTNQLDAVASTARCDSCHRVGLAGRFPEISSQLSFYCSLVLRTAVGEWPGASWKRTMPQGGGSITPYDDHVDSLQGSCGGPPSGGGVVVEVNYANDPAVLSPPIVIDPLYGCATSVSVRGAVLDAKVSLLVNGNPVGIPIFPARNTQKLEFTPLPALVAGDVVTAVQEKDGVSATSWPVTVRDHRADFPTGLPAPSIDPVLVYECASVISVRHVPGATVTIYSNGGLPVKGSGSTDWTVFGPGKQPFVVGDIFTAEQSLCGDPASPLSTPVTAVGAPGSLPPAQFNPPLTYAGQELVTLEGLTNGGTTVIAVAGHGQVGKFSFPVSWFSDFDVATPLGRPLNPGDTLNATHFLCQLSVGTEGPRTSECDELPAPRIQHPIVGSTFVVVTSSIPGARVRVYDAADIEIGDGSGTIIALTRAITGSDVLTVVQQLGECTSKTGYRASVRNPNG